MLSLVAALAAAACFAASTVAQHRAALTAPDGGALQLLPHLLRQPLWVAGLVLGLAALALQALALRHGAIVVVQPLLVLGLLLALPLSDLVARRRPSAVQLAWGAAVAAGLVVFLLAARPDRGRPLAPDGPLATSTAVCAAAFAVALVVGLLVRRARALALGLAGGVAIGIASALLKQVVVLAARHPAAPLADWSLYALVGAGLVGVATTQAGYHAGALSASQPAHTIAEPVAAAFIGATAFAEHLSSAPLAVLAQVLGALVMVSGVVGLALTAPVEHLPGAPPAPVVPPPDRPPGDDRSPAAALARTATPSTATPSSAARSTHQEDPC